MLRYKILEYLGIYIFIGKFENFVYYRVIFDGDIILDYLRSNLLSAENADIRSIYTKSFCANDIYGKDIYIKKTCTKDICARNT